MNLLQSAIFRVHPTYDLNTDKGEVGGSSPPRPHLTFGQAVAISFCHDALWRAVGNGERLPDRFELGV
jgi:hypothetical protein